YAYCLATIVQVPYAYGLAMHLLHLRMREILLVLWRPLLASVLMVVVVRLMVLALHDPSASSMQQLPYLLSAIVVGALVYIGSAYVFWRLAGRPEGAEEHVLMTVRNRLASWRKATPVDGAN
ncbi:MAG TPA: hypothetical protein VJM53_07310, partial [Burkholderiales bacterium]|nr:hypothetical protein [Burkholderiales bacterium]